MPPVISCPGRLACESVVCGCSMQAASVSWVSSFGDKMPFTPQWLPNNLLTPWQCRCIRAMECRFQWEKSCARRAQTHTHTVPNPLNSPRARSPFLSICAQLQSDIKLNLWNKLRSEHATNWMKLTNTCRRRKRERQRNPSRVVCSRFSNALQTNVTALSASTQRHFAIRRHFQVSTLELWIRFRCAIHECACVRDRGREREGECENYFLYSIFLRQNAKHRHSASAMPFNVQCINWYVVRSYISVTEWRWTRWYECLARLIRAVSIELQRLRLGCLPRHTDDNVRAATDETEISKIFLCKMKWTCHCHIVTIKWHE